MFGRIEAGAARPGTVLSPDWTQGWFLMTVLWAASLVGAILMATPPLWQYMGDVLVLFDGGWRIYNGQVPHADFYSCLGPVPMGVLGLGFHLTGGHSPGLGLSLGLFGIVMSLLAFIAAQGRLSRFWGLAFSLFVLTLVTAPAALGLKDVNTDLVSFRYSNTYAMFYNRLGWAAIIVAQLCVLMPRRNPGAGLLQNESVDGFIAGLACTLAVFTKINFLAVGGLMIVIAFCIPRPRGKTHFATGMVAGIAAMTLLLGIWPGGAWAYFQDTVTLLKVHRAESHVSSLFYKTAINIPWLLLLAILTISMLANARRIHGAAGSTGPASEIRTSSRAALIVMATGLFLTGFNFEGSAYPSLLLAGLFLIQLSQAGQNNGQVGSGDGSLRIVLVKSAVLTFLSVFLWFNAGSIAYAHLWELKNRDWQKASGVVSGALTKSIPIPIRPTEKADRQSQVDSIKAGKWSSLGMTFWINDGTELLASHIRKEDRVFVPDWVNPFNLTLSQPPAKGGALLWDYERMVDDRVYPSPEKTLADVTLFMAPKTPFSRIVNEFMMRKYGQGLEKDFVKTGESDFWTLWARKNRAP